MRRYKLLKIRNVASICFFMLWVNCFSQNQVSREILFESKYSEVKKLFAQKKYPEAITAINKLVLRNPDEGINYFSRAVLDFYNKKSSWETDTTIINDCSKAQKLGYANSELNYLLFLVYLRNIDFLDLDHFTYENPSTSFDEIVIDPLHIKEQIDAAIDRDVLNEKYLASRSYLLGKIYKGKVLWPNTNYISKADLQTLENDCNFLKKFSKIKKNQSYAYWQLSQISLYEVADTIKSIEYLTNAIECTPENPDLLWQRGSLKHKMKYYQGAIADYTTYLNKKKFLDDFEDADIFKKRGDCYSELKKDSLSVLDYTRSIQMLERAKEILLKKNDAAAASRIEGINIYLRFRYYDRGIIYVQLKQDAKACKDFNKAIDLGSTESIDLIKKYCR